ncbi:entericidin B [Citrobacter freundii]|uniref:Entericidin B n=1 Tax=Citrobacter freundii TaxID=546 RepID=A0AB33H933_CITFR|nr:entericidin B [Citrobacter freundii]POU19904.1 entericidin B [Citrobacter freundii complex sp. CFNIH8]POV60213.1 entericidin B [Citrobacter freundii complex sp. CFNIH11]QAR67765.1 entericidin B [Citrobacter sp. SL156]TYE44212.1 entericidin B [Escherichia coli]
MRQKREQSKGVTNSKVVFYIHLQLIKDNIFSVVSCYK